MSETDGGVSERSESASRGEPVEAVRRVTEGDAVFTPGRHAIEQRLEDGMDA